MAIWINVENAWNNQLNGWLKKNLIHQFIFRIFLTGFSFLYSNVPRDRKSSPFRDTSAPPITVSKCGKCTQLSQRGNCFSMTLLVGRILETGRRVLCSGTPGCRLRHLVMITAVLMLLLRLILCNPAAWHESQMFYSIHWLILFYSITSIFTKHMFGFCYNTRLFWNYIQ